MQIASINVTAQNTDQMIEILKQGLPTDVFDNLKKHLNISEELFK